MAEMVGGGGGAKGKGGPKAKKKSTRIDMTAMVDVAFLLLTFFVLTATITNSQVMDLTMPPKDDKIKEDDLKVDVVEDKVMTIVLCPGDTIKYYVGITKPDVIITDYSDTGIRAAMKKHINRYSPICAEGQKTDCWDPIFLIKPRYNCRYQNVVDILDEMAITGAKKYAMDPFKKEDSISLVKFEKPE